MGTSAQHWPQQNELLNWCTKMGPAEAALLVMAGVIYLLWGVQMFKWLVTINFALMCACVGAYLGRQGEAEVICAVIGAFAGAAIAWPLMKYAVALMGGVVGALLGGSVWVTCGLDGRFAWAGALTGLVALGMLSFIIFRGSIILYMSVQGAAMLVFGVLGLGYKYPSMASSLNSAMRSKPFLLPMAVILPMVCGFIFQHTKHGGAGKPEGAGGGKK
jgi:hypothetical protein